MNDFKDLTKDKGVRKRIVAEGSGELIKSGCSVLIEYTIYLYPSLKKVDSTMDKSVAVEFIVGEDDELMLECIQIAVGSMRLGEKAMLYSEAKYAFQALGNLPHIPPNSSLRLDVEIKHVSFPVVNTSVQISSAAKLKDQGNTHFQAKEFTLAINNYEKGLNAIAFPTAPTETELVAINRLVVSLNSNLAACHLKEGTFKSALACCQKVLYTEHDNPKAIFRYSQAASGLLLFDDAIKCLEKGLKINPDEPTLKNEVVRVNKMRKDIDVKEKEVYAKMF